MQNLLNCVATHKDQTDYRNILLAFWVTKVKTNSTVT
jgi:hypothetical protein